MKPDAAAVLLSILGGKARVQAISTVAALGVADRLAEGPRTVESLASELGCAVAVLTPLLRLVAGLGFFDSPQPGSYALTELGAVLKKDALGPFAAFVGAREQWDPWSALREAASDGSVAFVKTFGMGLYEFLAREPAAAARYDAAIDAFTKHEADVLCAQFDFGAASRVVDVGGGRGTLLASILQRWEHLHGVLFDLPHVADRARSDLEQRFGARVRVQAGDFFTDLPAGADVHLLRHVLHNWNDEQALRLLRRCAAAIVPGGRVLVIETILAPDNRADLACMLDLEMMVLTGGRERRRPELRRLLTAAGLAIERTVPMTSGSWLLVGVRALSA